MRTATAAPQTILGNILKDVRSILNTYFPGLLVSRNGDYKQPLLNSEEIMDLQLRVNSKTIQPQHSFDVTEQRSGDRRSIYRGYGLDYEESRPYQSGDEPRYINWKLTARTGELYLKVFREEHRPGIVVLLDRRETMKFGTRTRLKISQAARVATCIAFYAQQHHSSISAIVLEANKKNPALIKALNIQQASTSLIRSACAPCPPVFSPSEDKPEEHAKEDKFGLAISILQETHRPGSTIYVISDFIDLEDQHRAKLIQLAAHNNVHAIHIYDPAEKDFPKSGVMQFRGFNDEQDMTIDTRSMLMQKTYRDIAEKHFASRKQLFSSLNITYTAVSTNDDSIETVFSII